MTEPLSANSKTGLNYSCDLVLIGGLIYTKINCKPPYFAIFSNWYSWNCLFKYMVL